MKTNLLFVLSLLIFSHSVLATGVESLWKQYLDEELSAIDYSIYSKNINREFLGPINNIRLEKMDSDFLSIKSAPRLVDSLTESEALAFVSEQDYLAGGISLTDNAKREIIVAKEKLERVNDAKNLSKEELREIFNYNPDMTRFYDGDYLNSVTLFLVCRKNRKYPCRFILKDIHGDFVKRKSGTLWSMPVLAMSRKGSPYNVTNGQTPMGIHRIDSVMPNTNRKGAFGKFRRLKLFSIKNSEHDEQETKLLLPIEQRNKNWWMQASIARDVGRKHFRIHGTGKINKKPRASYYPHMPTSGCISTREGKYPKLNYRDQRKLLDIMMENSQLFPVYRNEPNIKGLLYVVELDDKKSKVTAKEIANILKGPQ